MSIQSIIKSNKPNLKETSLNLYENNLNKLNKYINNNKNILENIKNKNLVIDTINKNYTTTSSRRNIYTAILSILKQNNKLYTDYKTLEQGLNNLQNKMYINNDINPKKKKKIDEIDEDDIDYLLSVLLKNDELENYLIFKLVYTYGFRNEISNLKIIQIKNYNKLVESVKNINNYLVFGSKALFIVRNIYKTSGTYGEVVTQIQNKELKKYLKKYIVILKKKNDIYLFNNLTSNQFSNRMRYISNKYLGVEISGNLLYKISNKKYSKNKQELGEKARNRGHSIQTQSLVYIP